MNSVLKTKNNATPKISSGMTNEKTMTKFDAVAGRVRHRSTPIANATPSGTAISVV